MASSTLARAMATVSTLARHPSSSLFIPSRLLSSSATVTQCPSIPTLIIGRRFLAPLSHALRSLTPSHTSRFIPVRCCVNQSNSGSNVGFRLPMDMASLFPGCDYKHWLIIIDKPGGDGATKERMIDCYIRTLAKVVGGEEEAKKKIYNVSCERYFGFGCEIDEETSSRMEGLPGVLFVLPDSYVDAENKDYGAELFVNGEIVERSPERQRRVRMEPQPRKSQYRRRNNDKTRPRETWE